jgi:hypothetical protein
MRVSAVFQIMHAASRVDYGDACCGSNRCKPDVVAGWRCLDAVEKVKWSFVRFLQDIVSARSIGAMTLER